MREDYTMNDWNNSENWSSSALAYSEKSNVLYFDSTAEYETAVYILSVPEEAGSFTLSFKAGNSHSAAKEGAKDTGYITVSTDSGVIAKTPMIQDNLTYVSYTLTDAPVQAEQLYITAEAYNSYGNSVDFYFGNFELRQADKEIFNIKNKTSAKLTEREVSIIKYLYKSRGKTISKKELLQNVWGYNIEVSTHTIETHIYRLRKKIEEKMQDKQFIEADNGGYKLIF